MQSEEGQTSTVITTARHHRENSLFLCPWVRAVSDMKVSVTVTCHCGHQTTLETSGTQDPADPKCSACDTAFYFVQPLGNFVGMRIFNRAWTELQNGDFTLVIVLSAMAVECELARLFFKWHEVDLFPVQIADKDELEKTWRKWVSIAVRLDKVSTLLTGESFDSFLSHNPEFLKSISTKYPTFTAGTSPKDFFIKEFFYKRNKIVHAGEINYQQPDGDMCFTLANALLGILEAMDKQRIKAMDEYHTAQINGGGNL